MSRHYIMFILVFIIFIVKMIHVIYGAEQWSNILNLQLGSQTNEFILFCYFFWKTCEL